MNAEEVREILRAGGIPIGGPGLQSVGMPDKEALRRSLERSADVLETHEMDALNAWVAAFRHHWPESSTEWIGDASLPAARAMDPNRFVKLRRLAIANLARALNAP